MLIFQLRCSLSHTHSYRCGKERKQSCLNPADPHIFGRVLGRRFHRSMRTSCLCQCWRCCYGGVSEDPKAWQVHSMSTLTGPLSLSDKELSPQANSTCCLRQEEAGTASRAQNPSRAEQGWEAGVSSSWG